MKVSRFQLPQHLSKIPLIKSVLKLWKHWKVRAKADSLSELKSLMARNKDKPLREPHSSLKSHTVSAHQTKPSNHPVRSTPSIKIGVTYSEEAFELECAAHLFPSKHSEAVSSALRDLRQLCTTGTDRISLLHQLQTLEEAASLFQDDCREMPKNDRYLAVGKLNQMKVVPDTRRNRARYGIPDSEVASYQLDLRSIRLQSIDKIHALTGHIRIAVGPEKLVQKLEKLESRFERQVNYTGSLFFSDLEALAEKVSSMKADLVELLSSNDDLMKDIGEAWLTSCQSLERRIAAMQDFSRDKAKPYRRKPHK